MKATVRKTKRAICTCTADATATSVLAFCLTADGIFARIASLRLSKDWVNMPDGLRMAPSDGGGDTAVGGDPPTIKWGDAPPSGPLTGRAATRPIAAMPTAPMTKIHGLIVPWSTGSLLS